MSKPLQLVADIGGTNARFAWVEPGSLQLQGVQTLAAARFPHVLDAIRHFTETVPLGDVSRVCLAVAAPITGDRVDFPNSPWAFSRVELADALGVPVMLINDFSAQALNLEYLGEAELRWIGSGARGDRGPRAVLGPGTGLGVAALLPGGEIVPSEGGHIAFAPVDDHQISLLEKLLERYCRVSLERVLSGEGLANLYWANSCLAGREHERSASQVSAGARAGDAVCQQAVDDFLDILASTAGDVALMMGATGGVYIAGGMTPKLLQHMNEQLFRQRFDDKGRYRPMCEATPLAIVLSDRAGLCGCAVALQGRAA